MNSGHAAHRMKQKVFQVGRFIISGASAAAVNIGTLYLLTSIFGMWYIPASAVAFLGGFVVSFTLQKFWTFADDARPFAGGQILFYFAIVLFNLGLNTVLVYSFVEYLALRPVVAQALASILIACESFFAYRFVFVHRSSQVPDSGVL